jgi:hypothetical protein
LIRQAAGRVTFLARDRIIVWGENDTVKKRPEKSEGRTKSPPLNLSGIKFEDAVRAMLSAPPVEKTRQKKKN